MAGGIATHILRLFPDLNDIRHRKMFLPPGSLIAHFSQQRENWIYNLVTKSTAMISLLTKIYIKAYVE